MFEQIYETLKVLATYDQQIQQFGQIEGYLHTAEGAALSVLAISGPGSGEVVEIGSFKGRSTCFLSWGAAQARRGKVTAIDHFCGSPQMQRGAAFEDPAIVQMGSTRSAFDANLQAAGLIDQVEVMDMPEEQAAENWQKPIRLLFIDGDHSYDSTKRDFELFSPHVVPDGVICFHDYGTQSWPGVTRFVNELVAQGLWKHRFTMYSLFAVSRDPN